MISGDLTEEQYELFVNNLPLLMYFNIPVEIPPPTREEVIAYFAGLNDLTLSQVPEVTSLDGLQWIELVTGNVDISNNTTLTAEIDLPNLSDVGGYLTISGNSSVPSVRLAGLNMMTENLTVSFNSALTRVDLPNLVNSGTVNITDNTDLTFFDISSLRNIDGYLSVSGNPGLNTFDIRSLDNIAFGVYLADNGDPTNIIFSSGAKFWGLIPGTSPIV